MTLDTNQALDTAVETDTRYRAGTLQFTRASLVMLFVWLMWGDFCFTLMETVEPTVMPFMMDKLKASSTLISIFLVTIPAFMNFLLNPIISVKSDRYRSKWGRRIPFLVFSAPFIALFLTLTGFSPEIGAWLHAHVITGLQLPVVSLGFLGIALVAYRFFNYFTATVFYYLFNDVVPEHFMGRFTTGFRAFAVIANFVYQWFVFKYAGDHARWIFTGVGLLYLLGFTLMCWKVKEGEYPPPEAIESKSGIVANIRAYCRECFCHRFYVVWFSVYALFLVFSCAGPFLLLMQQKALGISMEQIGHMGGIGSVASFVVLFPSGFLSDKYHPFRVFLAALASMVVISALFAIVTIGFRFSHHVTYHIVWGFAVLFMPLTSVAFTAIFPLGMRLLPRSRYGQYCSAGAMVSSLFIMLGGYIVGALLDWVKNALHGDISYLRYVTAWSPLSFLGCLIASLVLFGMWKKLGGDKSFTPPEPDAIACGDQDVQEGSAA